MEGASMPRLLVMLLAPPRVKLLEALARAQGLNGDRVAVQGEGGQRNAAP